MSDDQSINRGGCAQPYATHPTALPRPRQCQQRTGLTRTPYRHTTEA